MDGPVIRWSLRWKMAWCNLFHPQRWSNCGHSYIRYGHESRKYGDKYYCPICRELRFIKDE